MSFDLHLGDCLATLKTLPDNSIDSIVTDPPYGLSFMGKKWDYDVPSVEIWAECLRVLKPGGHLLAFAGTRTQHRMAVRIEAAGFEIRDMIAWVYGSGFPKSLDVSKAIDKSAGAARTERLAPKPGHEGHVGRDSMKALRESGALSGAGGFSRPWMHDPQKVENAHWNFAPATDAARQWQGWGTALKPALEPITVARKPLVGTVASNVLEWGTGAINVDGCRVGVDEMPRTKSTGVLASENRAMSGANYARETVGTVTGRWPANLIHDGSDEVVAGFPVTGPSKAAMYRGGLTGSVYGNGDQNHEGLRGHDDNGGSAARFFYCAKASKHDREEGLEGFDAAPRQGVGALCDGGRESQPRANIHPTVKPTDLMRYLCRLVTPPGGVVLDPFMGSGSTGKAAMLEGFRFVGCEMSPEYLEIARARIAHALWGDLA